MKRRARHGLSMPELLISLAISSMLLASIAAAVVASGSATEMNDNFFRATQAARICTNEITNEIRRCTAVTSASGTQIELSTWDGFDKTWQYVAASGTTPGQITVTDNATATTHVLANNVSAARFITASGQDANNHTAVTEIALVMTVQVGANQVTVSGAAAPRVYLQY